MHFYVFYVFYDSIVVIAYSIRRGVFWLLLYAQVVPCCFPDVSIDSKHYSMPIVVVVCTGDCVICLFHFRPEI